MLVLRFSLAGIAHAINCHDIVEVIPGVDAQPLFGAPAWMKGMFVFRGQPIPLIDLGQLIAQAASEDAYSSRILVVRCDGHLVGLVADRATDVEKIPENQITPTPMRISGAAWSGRLINRPSSEKLTFLIDPASVLPPEIRRMLTEEERVS